MASGRRPTSALTDEGGRHLAAHVARNAIFLTILAQVLIAAVPPELTRGAWTPADGPMPDVPGGGVPDFESWVFQALSLLSAVSAVGYLVCLCALPFLGLWVLRRPGYQPAVWLRVLAWLAGGLVLILLLQSLSFALPGLSILTGEVWYVVSTGGNALAVLVNLPVMVSVWTPPLVLIAVLCVRADSPGLSILVGSLCVIVLGLTLSRANAETPPEGKALVIVLAGLWLWLSFARPGVIARGAQPWIAALVAVWTLPEVIGLITPLGQAMQIDSPSERWGKVAQVLAQTTPGIALGTPVMALLMVVALWHLALQTGRAAVLPILCAVLIGLGLILPEVAWQRGVAGSLYGMITMLQSGEMNLGPALLGASAALSWPILQGVLVLTGVLLLRLPVKDTLPR
jgi:hypothetical protein